MFFFAPTRWPKIIIRPHLFYCIIFFDVKFFQLGKAFSFLVFGCIFENTSEIIFRCLLLDKMWKISSITKSVYPQPKPVTGQNTQIDQNSTYPQYPLQIGSRKIPNTHYRLVEKSQNHNTHNRSSAVADQQSADGHRLPASIDRHTFVPQQTQTFDHQVDQKKRNPLHRRSLRHNATSPCATMLTIPCPTAGILWV